MNLTQDNQAALFGQIHSCGFIGLGLIGGSIAKALKAANPGIRITAYAPHRETVDAAMADGIVDIRATGLDASFSDVDILFLCAPVADNNDNLETLLPYLSPETILTDIGSVKSGIHEKAAELGLDSRFIGGHPMAGTERIGYRNSKAGLLENAYYILTCTEETNPDKLAVYSALVRTIGALPLIVPYPQHDYLTAAISHVPHVISASLVHLIEDNDTEDALMKTIAAGGFKDITRISSSSPVMWQQICLTNADNILKLLRLYQDELASVSKAIEAHDEDALYDFFNGARAYRESFIEASHGPIKKSYRLRLDIADRPGSLAVVVALLSANSINIRNIGIVHNREYEGGTLDLELHREEDMEAARKLLIQQGYTLH